MVTADLQSDLVAVATIVGGVAAGLGVIWAVANWLSRVTWPTVIRWAHVYNLADPAASPDLVVNTRVRNRRHVDEQLLHYFIALVPWTQRVIPGFRLRSNLNEISLQPWQGYVVPPTIESRTATTTWCRVTDGDLLLRERRRYVLFGAKGFSYRKFLVVGKNTWHVRRHVRLVTGYDGRKAIRKVRGRSGSPVIPPPPRS